MNPKVLRTGCLISLNILHAKQFPPRASEVAIFEALAVDITKRMDFETVAKVVATQKLIVDRKSNAVLHLVRVELITLIARGRMHDIQQQTSTEVSTLWLSMIADMCNQRVKSMHTIYHSHSR